MNTDTGKAYTGKEAVEAAAERGEALVPISEKAARRIKSGRGLLARKLQAARRTRRSRKRERIAKTSRRANRK
jgi:hypothetical protein